MQRKLELFGKKFFVFIFWSFQNFYTPYITEIYIFLKSEFSMHSRDGLFCYFRDSKLYKINQAAQNKGTKNEFFCHSFIILN